MADWAYAPQYDARWEDPPPPTLITRLSDGTSIRRQKSAAAIQTWEETYWLTGAEQDAAHAFFKAKYLLTAFTKLSYDVAGTPTTERSVYFAGPWSAMRSGPGFFVVTLAFELAV